MTMRPFGHPRETVWRRTMIRRCSAQATDRFLELTSL